MSRLGIDRWLCQLAPVADNLTRLPSFWRPRHAAGVQASCAGGRRSLPSGRWVLLGGGAALPEPLSFGQWVDLSFLPPALFVADCVDCPMMRVAKRHDPLITDLGSHRTGLCEADVVRMAGRPTTYEARKRGNEPQMLPVPSPPRSRDRRDRHPDGLAIFALRLRGLPSLLIEGLEEVGIVGLAAARSEIGKVLAQHLEREGIASPQIVEGLLIGDFLQLPSQRGAQLYCIRMIRYHLPVRREGNPIEPLTLTAVAHATANAPFSGS